MVDNWIRPLRTHVGLIFSSFSRPGRPLHPVARSPHLLAASLSCLCQVAEPLLTSGLSTSSGWERRKRRTEHFPCCAPSGRFARCQSFRPLPVALRQQVATSRLPAAQVPRAVPGEDAQNDSRHATTRGEQSSVGEASLSPRCDEPERLSRVG